MKINFVFLFLLCFSVHSSFAQQIVLSGVISQMPSNNTERVVLYLQRGLKELPIDSVVPNWEGKFSFSNKQVKSQGFFKIAFKGGRKTEFIIGKEPILGIETSYDLAINNGFPIKSKELDAMAILENLKLRYESTIDSLYSKGEKFDEYDSQYLAKTNAREAIVEAYNNQFNQSLNTVSLLFPGTYAAEVLANMYRIPLKKDFPLLDKEFDTQRAFMNKHYFMFANLEDERFINCKYIEAFVFKYLSRYCPMTFNGFKQSVEMVLKKASTNTVTHSFLLSYFLDLFAEKGPPEMLEYLSSTYGSSCENQVSGQTQELLNKVKALAVGSIAPDISAPDINMAEHSLYSSLGKKATLIYFWSSTCSHCQSQSPKVFETYEKLKGKGFEVYAVSLDTDFSSWLKFIQDNKLAWTNVCDFKGWKSKTVDTYMANKTPFVVLLDGNKKIVEKDFSLEDLDAIVMKLLK